MPATIYARLKHLIIEQLGVEEEDIADSSSFTDDFNADSLELADLVSSIEEEFGLEIPGEDARRLLTVQEVVDYIEEHVA